MSDPISLHFLQLLCISSGKIFFHQYYLTSQSHFVCTSDPNFELCAPKSADLSSHLSHLWARAAGWQFCARLAVNRRPRRAPAGPQEERPPARAAAASTARKRGRARSVSAGRGSAKDLHARYWTFLFENLRRAVDEIYQTCETDDSVLECKVSGPRGVALE